MKVWSTEQRKRVSLQTLFYDNLASIQVTPLSLYPLRHFTHCKQSIAIVSPRAENQVIFKLEIKGSEGDIKLLFQCCRLQCFTFWWIITQSCLDTYCRGEWGTGQVWTINKWDMISARHYQISPCSSWSGFYIKRRHFVPEPDWRFGITNTAL